MNKEAASARKAALEARVAPWTEAEREEWWTIHCYLLHKEVFGLVKATRVASAIALLIKEIGALAISQGRHRQRLEQRMAALEMTTVNGERTVVTRHDDRGRIVEFVKLPFVATLTKSEGETTKPRVRVKAVQEIIT